MSAAAMTTATVSRWTTGRNASVSGVYPIRFSVNGSVVLSCRWTSRWKRRSYFGTK